MLLDIVYKHKASLKMYDDLCQLVNDYSSSSDFDRHARLQSRKSFLRSIEETHCTQGLRPYHGIVQLHDNTPVTVPVFDTKQMIISMLTDPSLMNPNNFAEGYNVTFFNRVARNNPRFWRPFTYVPNLSYRKGTANQTPTKDKIQDEHTCISFAFKSLRKISEDNGFSLVVLGKKVHVKVWIHFFIGDIEGNNKWLGQYPGNKEGVQ